MKRAEVKKMLKAMITLVGPDAFQECERVSESEGRYAGELVAV